MIPADLKEMWKIPSFGHTHRLGEIRIVDG